MDRRWFIRDSSTAPLVEMLSFYEAELTARSRSKTNATGIIETVVEELPSGNRFVDAIFRRGRKLQQGQRARTSSKLGLPPSI